MIDIGSWTEQLLHKAEEVFGERLWFVGLQGSYARGEATATSDIDIVVILDDLSFSDIQKYNSILNLLPHRELACGFLSGKKELFNWEPSDLFQFYYDTVPLRGSLDGLLGLLDVSVIDRAIKIGACNVYHGCVHNMLYEKNDEILRGLYKSAAFVAQARAFKLTGRYIKKRDELLELPDGEIVKISSDLKNGGKVVFDEMSQKLFEWSKRLINETEK
ncbi:MAG: nucleotidyltransferase domain-containing protein [Clostridia bacterium]|nr:nucleotidyltransferase domain-containing protein [Clostridia bacterium]